MIFPLGFTRQYEFVIFKKMIGHPSALEFLLNLGEMCRNERTEVLCLPDDFISAALGLPPDTDPSRSKDALIRCGFITPVAGEVDVYQITLFSEENAALIARWKNGAKGGRKKKIAASHSAAERALTTHMPVETPHHACSPSIRPTSPERLDDDCPF